MNESCSYLTSGMFLREEERTEKNNPNKVWFYAYDPGTRSWFIRSRLLFQSSEVVTQLVMTTYNGQIYLVFSDTSSRLFYLSYDGANWTAPTLIPNTVYSRQDLAPTMVAYDGLLHLVYAEQSTNNILYLNFNGIAWSSGQQIVNPDGSPKRTRNTLALGEGLVLFTNLSPGVDLLLKDALIRPNLQREANRG